MFSGTHALLKYLVIYLNLKQGSCPDRGQSPVEWGEIPSICPSICSSNYPPPPIGLGQAQEGPSQALGDPIQALGGQSQALRGQSQALGGLG